MKLISLSLIDSDKALPHCRITSAKEINMSEQNNENVNVEELTEEQAAVEGLNPETGAPDNPDHGTYDNPIKTDYNTENVSGDEPAAEETSDEEDDPTPEPVDSGTAEGASSSPFGTSRY